MTSKNLIVQLFYEIQNSDGRHGFVKPIAEILGDQLIELTPENFCSSMKVFITGEYNSLQKLYSPSQYFKISVIENENCSENTDPLFASKYVAHARYAEPLKPRDYFDVIEASLPDCNLRKIALNGAVPGTNYIFIDDSKNLYGPFKWTPVGQLGDVIEINFIDPVLPYVSLLPYQVYEINRADTASKVFAMHDGKQVRRIVAGLSILGALGKSKGYYDYASNEEIVRYIGRLASDCNIKGLEKGKINAYAALIGSKCQTTAGEFNRKRLARLLQISTDTVTRDADIISGLSSFLRSDSGKEIVRSFVEDNQDSYLHTLKKEHQDEINAHFQAQAAEILIAEARLSALGESKIKLSGEVEELRRAASSDVLIDKAYADADAKLQEKKQALADLEKVIEEKTPLVNGMNTLLDLQESISKHEKALSSAKDREYYQRTALEAVELEFNKTDNALRSRLVKLKPFVDAINGAYAPDVHIEKQIFVATHPMKSSESLLVRQKEVVSEMGRRLTGEKRNLSSWQVANLLISTQQSFITFLAGMPGVGKTSLARFLASTQEISSNRLTEIAVGRGWTAQKDLIGFYNPLISRFQPSNTGLYAFLIALSGEVDAKAAAAAMAYVLLDEANLSPIEHYWSTFMGMADGGRNELQLGDKIVRIPEHLRFVATINYDSTTELLSPRVVDRAPIILIENDDVDSLGVVSQAGQPSASSAVSFPLAASTMEDLFGNTKVKHELQSDELAAFELVRNILCNNDRAQGMPVQISRRKIHAIEQYCAKAGAIMNVDNSLFALDLAIMQHVLPLVRGTGAAFAKRLALLLRELENKGLDLSAKRVRTMIVFGEDNVHNYDFFCW